MTFVYGDGIDSETLQVPYNTPINDIVPATRINGKAVLSWSTHRDDVNLEYIFNQAITQDLVLYPAELASVIDFDSNGGDAVPAVIKKAGEPLTLPLPTRMDYKFIAWIDDDGVPFKSTTMPNESFSLKAQWQAMIIFDENGGERVEDISVEAGNNIVLPQPYRADMGNLWVGIQTMDKSMKAP